MHLAIDTGIENILIMGDFNLNVAHNTSTKIKDICCQLSLHQIINSPTHFTESSSSVIDLIFTSNNHLVHSSEDGDPFLQQDVMYHCIYTAY